MSKIKVIENPLYTNRKQIQVDDTVYLIKDEFVDLDTSDYFNYAIDETKFFEGTFKSIEEIEVNQDNESRYFFKYTVLLTDGTLLTFKSREYWFKYVDPPIPKTTTGGGRRKSRRNKGKAKRKFLKKSIRRRRY